MKQASKQTEELNTNRARGEFSVTVSKLNQNIHESDQLVMWCFICAVCMSVCVCDRRTEHIEIEDECR